MTFNQQQQAQIQQAREVSIESVLHRLGISQKGKTYCCVFHDDNEDGRFNMSVYKDNNTVKCFNCGKNADAIALVQQSMGLPFLDAVEWINGGSIKRSIGKEKSVPASMPKSEPMPELSDEKKNEIYSHLILKTTLSSQGKAYLQGRSLDPTHCENLGLRCVHDNKTVVKLLRDRFELEELRQAGLLNEKENFRLLNRIIIPWIWGDRYLALQGRQIDDNPNFPRYLNAGSLPPFFIPLYPIESPELWVFEGAFNAITGVISPKPLRSIALATTGSGNKVQEIAQRLRKKSDIEQVVLSPDKEEGGQRLMKNLANELVKAGFPKDKIEKPNLKGCKDFNEYIQQQERTLA